MWLEPLENKSSFVVAIIELAKDIREFFWPLLEPPLKDVLSREIEISEITVEEKNLDTAYDLAIKYFENEESRRRTVETESSIFIGTVGFIITILFMVTKDFILNENAYKSFLSKPINLLLTLNLFIIVLYLSRVGWFAIKALERGSYVGLRYPDIINASLFYKKQVIQNLINKTRRNFKTINLKVDNMVMAQEYFKRFIVAIVFYSLLICLKIFLDAKAIFC